MESGTGCVFPLRVPPRKRFCCARICMCVCIHMYIHMYIHVYTHICFEECRSIYLLIYLFSHLLAYSLYPSTWFTLWSLVFRNTQVSTPREPSRRNLQQKSMLYGANRQTDRQPDRWTSKPSVSLMCNTNSCTYMNMCTNEYVHMYISSCMCISIVRIQVFLAP